MYDIKLEQTDFMFQGATWILRAKLLRELQTHPYKPQQPPEPVRESHNKSPQPFTMQS